jgi:hypothetical protein
MVYMNWSELAEPTEPLVTIYAKVPSGLTATEP